MHMRRDIRAVDARAVFRIAASVRWIVPCHGSAEMSTAV